MKGAPYPNRATSTQVLAPTIDGAPFVPSVLAPFSTVVALTATGAVQGNIVAKRYGTSSVVSAGTVDPSIGMTLQGRAYTGPIMCGEPQQTAGSASETNEASTPEQEQTTAGSAVETSEASTPEQEQTTDNIAARATEPSESGAGDTSSGSGDSVGDRIDGADSDSDTSSNGKAGPKKSKRKSKKGDESNLRTDGDFHAGKGLKGKKAKKNKHTNEMNDQTRTHNLGKKKKKKNGKKVKASNLINALDATSDDSHHHISTALVAGIIAGVAVMVVKLGLGRLRSKFAVHRKVMLPQHCVFICCQVCHANELNLPFIICTCIARGSATF